MIDKDDKRRLLQQMHEIWKEVDRIWTERKNHPAFSGYVSADYEEVFEQLWKMRDQAESFLEWGSGLGAVAMAAAAMGFEAYGIEAEEELVILSEELAEAFELDVEFAHGSFIPSDFNWDPATGANVTITQIDLPDAYPELGLDLADFDIIYAYPWPDEHGLLQDIVNQFGRRGAQLFTYDAHEGVQVTQIINPN